jgi:peptide/nickel transport system substrate-binding protein
MRRWLALIAALLLLPLTACRRAALPNGLTVLIDSSPTNLDPRVGTDASSEHIDSLIFDALVRRREDFTLGPMLATSWEFPDPLTAVFHLRGGVYFHDGRLLTASDVKWTIDSLTSGKIVSLKAASYATVQSVEAPDPLTVIIHLKKPDNTLLLNLCDGAFGVVPFGSGRDFWRHPVGSGPFTFVSAQQDRDVVLRRAASYWQPLPSVESVHFAIVPDAVTRALELQKGSADLTVTLFPADMLAPLARNSHLRVQTSPGTSLLYTVLNTRDPHLKDVRVRQAIAMALNRPLMVQTLFAGHARLADSVLPPEHWAWTADVQHYTYDPAAANALLDASGLRRGPDGTRFHLTIKTSTDETTRLVAVVMQQELAAVGIALEVRSFEFATFYSDITKGAFQLAPLRWIGGNEAPDIFRYAYSSASFPPKGANRGYYTDPEVDSLIAKASATADQAEQARDYVRVQQILAAQVPVIDLWYLDTVMVANRRVGPVHLSPSGAFDFLRTVTLTAAAR